ncbi:MAG: AsnC family protein [Cytophagales bacterium]|nr:AsnC family protein [Cytophagales bacterium]
MKKITEKMTTFEHEMQDPAFEKAYDKELKEFALSELMLALMEDDPISVRKLAELAGLSPTAIQDLRSGKTKDVKFKNFVSIIEACGYGIELVKGKKRIAIHSSMSNKIDFSVL